MLHLFCIHWTLNRNSESDCWKWINLGNSPLYYEDKGVQKQIMMKENKAIYINKCQSSGSQQVFTKQLDVLSSYEKHFAIHENTKTKLQIKIIEASLWTLYVCVRPTPRTMLDFVLALLRWPWSCKVNKHNSITLVMHLHIQDYYKVENFFGFSNQRMVG